MEKTVRQGLALLILLLLLISLPQSAAALSPGLPALSRAEELAMATFMQENRALLEGRDLYTLDYDAHSRPVLARYRLYNFHVSDCTVLAEDCVPRWPCLLGGQLYYINGQNGGVLESVDLSSGERRYLRAGPCSWLSARDGRLYYCREDGRFCSMVPGEAVESVLVDTRCFYAWLTDEDTLLYQDGDDGEQLHLRTLSTGEDRVITDEAAYAPLVWGGRVWYTGKDGLRSVLPDGSDRRTYPLPPVRGAAEFLPWGDSLWVRCLTEDNGLRQYSASLTGGTDVLYSAERGYRLCDYLGLRYRVDTLYQSDGRVRGFVLTDNAGNTLRYWMGEEIQ